jgi:outer membrane protein, heavy metal efflux system
MICSLLSLSLTGCIQFQDRPLKADEFAFRIESRTLSSEGLRDFIESATGQKTDCPSQSWNVDQLTLVAMYYHPDLALAGAQADSPDAVTITAVQRPKPSITILPIRVNNAAAGINPWIVVSAINIPIEFGGTRSFLGSVDL